MFTFVPGDLSLYNEKDLVVTGPPSGYTHYVYNVQEVVRLRLLPECNEPFPWPYKDKYQSISG